MSRSEEGYVSVVRYGGSVMICPLVRSTQWLNPSRSASKASSPRLFRSAQTVDFPTPELPVTHTNAIDESSHGASGHLGSRYREHETAPVALLGGTHSRRYGIPRLPTGIYRSRMRQHGTLVRDDPLPHGRFH